MSEESIFSQDPATVVNENHSQSQIQAPQFNLPPEVQELVGEGRKYKTAEDALRSLPHAQSHISKLEEEMKQMREELARRKAAEELLEEFRFPSPQEPQAQPQLDTNAIAALVDQTLEQREAKKTAQGNIDTVIQSFNEKFGEKAPEMYEKIAAENGLSVQFLNSVAAKSPQAVLNLAGILKQQVQPVPGKTGSSVNTESFSQHSNSGQLSAKLPKAPTTKDLVSAWRNAGTMVKQELGIQ